MLNKELKRKKRHYRLRKKIVGTENVPRLSVFRSLKNLNVQLIDDFNEKTLLSLSTISKEVKDKCAYGGNRKSAEALGNLLASKMKEKGLERICFDRAGYLFQGRIKQLAETLRKGGIKF